MSDLQNIEMNVDRVNDARRRIVAGEPVSDDEIRECIRWLAKLRTASVTNVEKVTKPTPQQTADAQSILDNLF